MLKILYTEIVLKSINKLENPINQVNFAVLIQDNVWSENQKQEGYKERQCFMPWCLAESFTAFLNGWNDSDKWPTIGFGLVFTH